jgi:hypothetical protein
MGRDSCQESGKNSCESMAVGWWDVVAGLGEVGALPHTLLSIDANECFKVITATKMLHIFGNIWIAAAQGNFLERLINETPCRARCRGCTTWSGA